MIVIEAGFHIKRSVDIVLIHVLMNIPVVMSCVVVINSVVDTSTVVRVLDVNMLSVVTPAVETGVVTELDVVQGMIVVDTDGEMMDDDEDELIEELGSITELAEMVVIRVEEYKLSLGIIGVATEDGSNGGELTIGLRSDMYEEVSSVGGRL